MNNKGYITTIGLAFVLLLSMPFASSIIIKAQTNDVIYENIEDIPKKEIALVLGAAAYGDRLSDVLRDRVDTAIDLYDTRKVDILVMSGAENETKAMKSYAIEKGINSKNIVEDPLGLNTLASVNNISELNRSVIIVTQRYHLPRALFIANHKGLDAVGMVADKHEYLKIISFKQRELIATSKAILDVFLFN
ncbi:YdcF family protein [Candidatus Peregrinibacteria bacterium]|nr:YdcF family protein [Candidatus Peregrinibacteria bacterium]